MSTTDLRALITLKGKGNIDITRSFVLEFDAGLFITSDLAKQFMFDTVGAHALMFLLWSLGHPS